MNPPDGTSRWPDERIDDLHAQLVAMRDVPQRVAVLENRLEGVADDVKGCLGGIEKLHQARSEERKERKRDLQWTIGAVFVAASIVIGALGLFLS